MSNTELYDRLGVTPSVTQEQIKKAFRGISRESHPDKGGDEEEFKKITEAYEILSDPEKRARYDKTGRTTGGITAERVKDHISNIMVNVVNAERPDGTTDDPVWENILKKVLDGLKEANKQLIKNKIEAARKRVRASTLAKRFKPLQKHDPVGDILRAEAEKYGDEIQRIEDVIELNDRTMETLISGYSYVVGPDPQGHYEPDPTSRLSSGGVFVLR